MVVLKFFLVEMLVIIFDIEYNITMENIYNYEPMSLDGKLLVDRAIFEELRNAYIRAQVLANIEKSERQIKEGKVVPAEVVFAKLRKKYGYKV